MLDTRTIKLVFAFVVTFFGATLLLSLIADSDSRAQPTTTSVLRTAGVKFMPLPNSTLFTPKIVQHVQRIAERQRWKLPPEEPNWAMMGEEPLVETRRRDMLWHVVAGGESRRDLRAKYRGSRYMDELNPEVDLNAIERGQKLLVWKRDPGKVSESRGKANRGRLIHGEPMPPGEGYRILYPHRAFGTYYTVSEVVRVLDDFHARFPNTPDLLVGDLSVRTGRQLRPHKSHQSGRDVDITYPRKTEPRTYRMFTYIRRADFDIEKTFWLVKHFLDRGHVEYMFIDRKWQYRLWKYAKDQGATDEWLSATFQYRSARPGKALIRYSRGHDKHLHIRFKCQETDRRCY